MQMLSLIEHKELEATNRRIVQAEDQIAAQRRRIEDLKAAGASIERSEALLALLLDSLNLMQRHRRQIVHALAEERDMRRRMLR